MLDDGPGQDRPDAGVELPAGGEVVVELAQFPGRQGAPTSTGTDEAAGTGPGQRRRLR
jgi:hypothetical protein